MKCKHFRVVSNKMVEALDNLRLIQRDLNTIEHMLYVSCKFTRTTEMLRKVMDTLITTYENFFKAAFETLIGEEEKKTYTMQDKIQILNEAIAQKGVQVDFSDYFLLKRLLLSDYDSVGEYRKNLAMISYIDGEEYTINLVKLMEFYDVLKTACNALTQS